MKTILGLSILTSLILSACGPSQFGPVSQARFAPQPRMNQFSVSPQYNPVPVNEVKRLAVDFSLGQVPKSVNALTLISYRCRQFIEQAKLREHGDIDTMYFESFEDGTVIRLTFMGVKNSDLIQNQVFTNLVQYVQNELRKSPPPASVTLNSVRLLDTSAHTPKLLTQLDLTN